MRKEKEVAEVAKPEANGGRKGRETEVQEPKDRQKAQDKKKNAKGKWRRPKAEMRREQVKKSEGRSGSSDKRCK